MFCRIVLIFQGNVLRKFLAIFLLFMATLFGEVLSVDQAFGLDINGDKAQGINVNLKVNDSVYLYKDKLKIKIENNDITAFLNLPESKKHDIYDIYGGNLNLFIPAGLLNNFVKSDKFSIAVDYQGCSYSGFCYQPMSAMYEASFVSNKLNLKKAEPTKIAKSSSDQDKIADSFSKDGKFLTLLTFFGYGLMLALTPCVFPMIPILSSIIVAKTGSKPSAKSGFFISFIYVFFMSLAYALAGVLASVFGASVQGLLQIPSVIIGFSIIFVLLAFSMFGLYNLELPKSLQAYINKKGKNAKGIIGVAVMGFLSALIVGPCVAAPLAGALLYIAKSGDALFGGLALFIMSFGMGVPLLLIGVSSKLLPRPGFWMEKVKQLFGFLMLGMAIWMFDRVVGSEISWLLYGVLGVVFAMFFGAFDEAKTVVQKLMKSVSIIILVVSCVLIANFTSAQLGFSPNLQSQKSQKIEFLSASNLSELNIIINSSQKPVMVDFWASWCVNCKELDNITFSDESVKNRLKDFTLVKIDVTKNSKDDLELMQKFSVFGPPALVFYKNSKELKDRQIVGFISAKDFLDHINSI